MQEVNKVIKDMKSINISLIRRWEGMRPEPTSADLQHLYSIISSDTAAITNGHELSSIYAQLLALTYGEHTLSEHLVNMVMKGENSIIECAQDAEGYNSQQTALEKLGAALMISLMENPTVKIEDLICILKIINKPTTFARIASIPSDRRSFFIDLLNLELEQPSGSKAPVWQLLYSGESTELRDNHPEEFVQIDSYKISLQLEILADRINAVPSEEPITSLLQTHGNLFGDDKALLDLLHYCYGVEGRGVSLSELYTRIRDKQDDNEVTAPLLESVDHVLNMCRTQEDLATLDLLPQPSVTELGIPDGYDEKLKQDITIVEAQIADMRRAHSDGIQYITQIRGSQDGSELIGLIRNKPLIADAVYAVCSQALHLGLNLDNLHELMEANVIDPATLTPKRFYQLANSAREQESASLLAQYDSLLIDTIKHQVEEHGDAMPLIESLSPWYAPSDKLLEGIRQIDIAKLGDVQMHTGMLSKLLRGDQPVAAAGDGGAAPDEQAAKKAANQSPAPTSEGGEVATDAETVGARPPTSPKPSSVYDMVTGFLRRIYGMLVSGINWVKNKFSTLISTSGIDTPSKPPRGTGSEAAAPTPPSRGKATDHSNKP